jgi:hypothetical protein
VLTDGHFLYFLAGYKRPQSSDDDNDDVHVKDASWLGATEADRAIWRSLFQQTISVDHFLTPPRHKIFTVKSMGDIDPSHRLSSVAGASNLSFYAGTPITSKHGVNIGIVFLVDDSKRKELSAREGNFLIATAQKCMQLLEFAREKGHRDRWTLLNSQIDRFVTSHDVLTQSLAKPTTLKIKTNPGLEKTELQQVEDIAHQFRGHSHTVDGLLSSENAFGKDSESRRLVEAEAVRDDRLEREDDEYNTRALDGRPEIEEESGDSKGETVYRKVFRRAAECLQAGLQVDGVMFSDGFIALHGSVQPVAEREQELEHEVERPPHRKSDDWDVASHTPRSREHQARGKEHAKNTLAPQRKIDDETTRVFTSAEYQRGVHIDLPAEILGIYTRKRELAPATTEISESILGMAKVNEGDLQRLMDRYPEGNVWYSPDDTNTLYSVKDDTLFENDSQEEMQRLHLSFPGIKQLIFRPLTDPVSLKHLAGCFIWSMQPWPILTDSVDLFALKGFLHIVQAEISRTDTIAATKQKETFVSSMSHELSRFTYTDAR